MTNDLKDKINSLCSENKYQEAISLIESLPEEEKTYNLKLKLASLYYDISDEENTEHFTVNPDLELWIGSVERFIRSSANVAGVIHRGFSSFGKTKYRNMPYWSIPMEFRRRMPQLPMICDPSHIGGRRDLVQEISVHAMNLNFEGLFIESHINPDTALSDRNQQILPEQLGKIIAGLAPLAGNSRDSLLNSYREEIDAIDEQLLSLLSKRMHISEEIGKYKKQHAISVFQQARYEHIIKERIRSGTEAGLDRNFIERIMRELHEESVRVQMEIVDAEDTK